MNKLPRNWLSIELASMDAELALWPAGLLDSFRSAYPDLHIRTEAGRSLLSKGTP